MVWFAEIPVLDYIEVYQDLRNGLGRCCSLKSGSWRDAFFHGRVGDLRRLGTPAYVKCLWWNEVVDGSQGSGWQPQRYRNSGGSTPA